MLYAVYRCLYGEGFIQESINSITDYVDKIFVFWDDTAWGNIDHCMYKGQRVDFPKKFDNIVEKIKELKKQFADAANKIKGKFDRKKFKDATDEEKAALRDKLKASRKEWEVAMKAHRVEVGKRMKEIREEFKNNRDKVIEGNKPGE